MALNIPECKSERIVVAGGGFAGLTLVKKLINTGYQVVLIDRNNFHQFPPLFYQVATAAINPGDIAFPFRKIFRGKKNIFFRMTEVISTDPLKKRITTRHGSLSFDHLVLAMGSSTNYFGMRDIERESLAMKDISEALAIRNKVLMNIEKAVGLQDGLERTALLNIVIAGGGATGIELAGAFAEMKNNIIPKDYPEYHHENIGIDIHLIEGSGKLIGSMSEKTSAESLEYLRKAGVNVILNDTVTGYRHKKVFLKDGPPIPTHNLIWASGVTIKIPEGLEKCFRGKGGRIVTDDFFKVMCYDNVYVIGDASVQVSEKYPNGHPQLARVAIEQASHLARNFKLLKNGKTPEPYVYKEYPVLATVGRNHAFAEYRSLRMKGFSGWILWAAVHLFSILGVKNKINIFWGWFWNYITYDLPARVIISGGNKDSVNFPGSSNPARRNSDRTNRRDSSPAKNKANQPDGKRQYTPLESKNSAASKRNRNKPKAKKPVMV